MKNNRRPLVYLFILIAASVFFVSCGQPTYRTLSGISIKSSTDDSKLNFSFYGNDSDLNYVFDGPGLILTYVTSDSPSLTERNSIISKFSSTYGSSSGLGINVVRPEAGKSLIDDYSLYSFTTSNKNQVTAWKYHYDLTQIGSSIADFFVVSSNNGTILLENQINGSKLNFYSTDGSDFEKGQYVHIFASFTCQSTSNNVFSNIYWSNLYYLGNLRIE